MRLNGGAIQRPRRTASKGQDEVMTEPFVSRGFRGRRQPGATAARLPPGQYETRDFPVLSAGPTPRTSLVRYVEAGIDDLMQMQSSRSPQRGTESGSWPGRGVIPPGR